MNSEDLKKQHIRTQGKYSDTNLLKNREKKDRVSPKEKNEKRGSKRYSNERRKSDEHSAVKYEEKSKYGFTELEEPKKPVEISDPGKHVISSTERGESVIHYKPDLFNEDEAWDLFDRIKDTTAWSSKNIVIRGEEYPQPRLVAWYGPYPYSYSGTTLEAAEMPDLVLAIKQKIEAYLNDQGIKAEFNSVLLNLYRNEKDSVAWHSDDELTMGICPTIASISLGEVRRFEIRPKKRCDEENNLELQQMFMNLCHGSLVVMDGCMQEDWQHRIPKEYHDKESRINLTFRTVFPFDESPCLHEMEYPKQLPAPSSSTKATNSGGVIEFNDTNFPALGSDVETNRKLSEPFELVDNNVCSNSNDDENLGESASEDEESWYESTDATALMPPNDTTENDPRRCRDDKPQNKQSNEIFRREPFDESKHPIRQDDKRYSRFPSNQNRVGRGSNRKWNYDDRTNKQLDKEGEGQDEVRTWRSREENEVRRWYTKDENQERRFAREFRKDENDGRCKRDENQERRFAREFRKDENDGRCKRDENQERRFAREFRRNENQERNFRKDEDQEGMFRRDENQGRRFRREDLDERFSRRQNDNARQRTFSNLQNDERQVRNFSSRNDDRCHGRVPQTQNGDRRNEVPPRYSNNRGIPLRGRSRLENKTNSAESFDNYRHTEELVNNRRIPPRGKSRLENKTNSAESFDNYRHTIELVKEEHANYTLNAGATVFVPRFQKPVPNYDEMSLEQLLELNVRMIHNSHSLQSYSQSLKSRVLEILDEFEPDEKGDLKFLCAITDGSQNTKNQQMISIRMAKIASNYTNRKNAPEDS